MSFLDAIFGGGPRVSAARVDTKPGEAALQEQGDRAAAQARASSYGMATMNGANAGNIRTAQMAGAQAQRDANQNTQIQQRMMEQQAAEQNAQMSQQAEMANVQAQHQADAAQLGLVAAGGAAALTGGASLAAPGMMPMSDASSKQHIAILQSALDAERAKNAPTAGRPGAIVPPPATAQYAQAPVDAWEALKQRSAAEFQQEHPRGVIEPNDEQRAYEHWAAQQQAQASPAATAQPQTSDVRSKQQIAALAEHNARLSQALLEAGQRATRGTGGPAATSGANAPGQGAGAPAQTSPATDALMPLRPVSYEYKPGIAGQPGAPTGRHTGVLADDLERTPAGAATVQPGPDGLKRVDPGRLSLLLAAADAEQERRLRRLESERATMPQASADTGGL